MPKPQSINRRRKYRKNAEFRERSKAADQRYRDKFKDNPIFRQLSNVRVRISRRRYTIDRALRRIEAYERELISLVKLRDKLLAQLRST